VSCVVALPRAVRERARVGTWTGAGVLAAVPLRERPDAASRPGHLGTLHGRLPRAGVPVGVVRPAARARPGGVKGPGTSPTLPSQRSPGGQLAGALTALPVDAGADAATSPVGEASDHGACRGRFRARGAGFRTRRIPPRAKALTGGWFLSYGRNSSRRPDGKPRSSHSPQRPLRRSGAS
jgi:hypothetical protein